MSGRSSRHLFAAGRAADWISEILPLSLFATNATSYMPVERKKPHLSRHLKAYA
jgi:hypothetical protein